MRKIFTLALCAIGFILIAAPIFMNKDIHEVVIQKCTQVGYSDAILNNVIGYFVDADLRQSVASLRGKLSLHVTLRDREGKLITEEETPLNDARD